MKAQKVAALGFFLFIITLTANATLSDLKNYSTKNFLIATAPTGCMPKGIKLDPVGTSLYVAEMCGKTDPKTGKRIPSASIYDLEKKKLTKTLTTPVGSRTGIYANTEVEFSLDEQWALITRSEGDENSEVFKNMGLLTVVDTELQKISKYIPLYGQGSKIIAARPFVPGESPRKQIVYVANYFTDDISIVDVAGLKRDNFLDGTSLFKGKIELHTNFKNPHSRAYFIAPRGIAFTPDGKYALILSTETGSLIIIDSVNHKQIAEIAPMNAKSMGRELNLRHIVISRDGTTAYFSHMRGNAISRIDLNKLISKVEGLASKGATTTLPDSIWDDLLIPFRTKDGMKKILVLENYPLDHPNFPGKTWSLAHPNTIVLDPVRNRYLYVSSRTTTDENDEHVDPKLMGKIDVIDLEKDAVVFSLVGGAQPTALEVSHDNRTLISSGFINDRLYFYDLKKILSLYEKGE
jgi:hypothetical protein